MKDPIIETITTSGWSYVPVTTKGNPTLDPEDASTITW